MADLNPVDPKPLADHDIVTERKVARRAFLGTAGAILMGGAAVLVAGARAAAQETKGDDADKKKKAGKTHSMHHKMGKKKGNDPDKKKKH